MGQMLPMLVIMGVIFYFMLIRPQKKKDQERKNMLARIGKNDKVVTVGGVHGIVTSVKENEVVLKVDDSNNVKMRFNRSAISGIVESSKSENEDEE